MNGCRCRQGETIHDLVTSAEGMYIYMHGGYLYRLHCTNGLPGGKALLLCKSDGLGVS
jgi:hypothetical protein